MHLVDLVQLHQQHDRALYARNIRGYLGRRTDVNASIQKTLADAPGDFVYLNNGVTALCSVLEPKAKKKGGKQRLVVRGLSIINGAQTIASAADFSTANPTADIRDAVVSFTLIKTGADTTFGKSVTRARNHQNPVLLANFAALDDEQERLRREIASLGIRYSYKAEAPPVAGDPLWIGIEEAAHALALLQPDPRYPVWLKKEPGRLLDAASSEYRALFHPKVSGFRVVNAVRFNRYVRLRMSEESGHAIGQERGAYKHGSHALGWLLAKRLDAAINSATLIDESAISGKLSADFDGLRNTLWKHAQQQLSAGLGPLALFRNQGRLIPLLRDSAIEHYGLIGTPAITAKQAQVTLGESYPVALFDYLAQQAPQIGL